MSENIKYINADQYETEVLKTPLVVVDFYSTECPPCEALAAKYEPLSELYGDEIKFIKIFRQENRELAERLGVKSSPTVLFYKHGEQVGEFLTGGIKREALVRNLDRLLSDDRVKQIKEKMKTISTACDVLILGGGPAGLTAGIYCAQSRLKTILVDIALPGGWVSTTHLVSNYPGFEKPVQGFMLAHFMSEQAKTNGVEFRAPVDVNRVDLVNKTVMIDEVETISAQKIIIATGSSPRPLGIPGETEYQGQGVSYCATCDAKYYTDQEVIVIGGGNSAIEESLFISKFASKVTVVHQFAELQANKIAQDKAKQEPKIHFLLEHEPRAFLKTGRGMEVEIEDLKNKQISKITAAGIFVFVGMLPNLKNLPADLALDQGGYIQTNELMETSIQGVYATGDVASKRYRQITTAVADGTIAGIEVSKSLESS